MSFAKWKLSINNKILWKVNKYCGTPTPKQATKNQNIEKQQENGEQKGKEQSVDRRIDARKVGVIENPSFYFKKVEGVEEELSRVLNYSLVLSALSALQGASQLGARPLHRLLCSLDNTRSEKLWSIKYFIDYFVHIHIVFIYILQKVVLVSPANR